MKKYILLAVSLFFTMNTQAQDRTQPKAGAAPKINIKKPESFTLANGLRVMVVENHKLPRVSFSLSLDNAPYAENEKKGVSTLLSAMLGNGTETTSKEKFNEEIDFLGADFDFNSNGASASGLSKYAGRLLELLADGALNPKFTQEDFTAEKNKLAENLKSNEKSVSAIAGRVENVLVFGKTHYNGEYISEETLKNVALQDVINNYNTYFVPANAYLVVVGDVKTEDVKAKAEALFGSDQWKSATAPFLSYNAPKDLQYTQINFIDVPNAVQSEISLVNVSTLKMTDKDYFAALMANQILGGGGEGRLFLNLREKHGWTYGAYSSLTASKYVGKFRCSASVRNAVTDSAVVEFLNELKRIRTEKVSDEELKVAKAKYVGNFVMQIEKPATIARYAYQTASLGLPADFYENYIKNLNAVTIDDVKAAANKYFLADNIRIVIVGKASEVLPALEEMSKREKLPISYFDKYGNKTEKPSVKKPVPAGITAQSVIKKYIDVIGGEAKLKEVKTVLTTMKANVQGQQLDLINKATSDNKYSSIISAMGMTIMKQVIGEKNGFAEYQGQKKTIEDEDFKESKEKAFPFFELNLVNNSKIQLIGVEKMNDSEVYVIQFNKSKLFYDVKTGLRTAIESEKKQGENVIKNTIYFNDYVEFKGIKFPYKMTIEGTAPMPLEFITQEIKINEGVSDKDFE